MTEKMIIEVRKKLEGHYTTDNPRLLIVDHIIETLETLSDKNLALTTAEEIIDGKFTMKDCYKKIEDSARKVKVGNCAMLNSESVFKMAREYFCIDAFYSVDKNPQKSSSLGVDFDSLFE